MDRTPASPTASVAMATPTPTSVAVAATSTTNVTSAKILDELIYRNNQGVAYLRHGKYIDGNQQFRIALARLRRGLQRVTSGEPTTASLHCHRTDSASNDSGDDVIFHQQKRRATITDANATTVPRNQSDNIADESQHLNQSSTRTTMLSPSLLSLPSLIPNPHSPQGTNIPVSSFLPITTVLIPKYEDTMVTEDTIGRTSLTNDDGSLSSFRMFDFAFMLSPSNSDLAALRRNATLNQEHHDDFTNDLPIETFLSGILLYNLALG